VPGEQLSSDTQGMSASQWPAKQNPPAQAASLVQSTRGTQVREVTEQTNPASQSASLSQSPVATQRPPTHWLPAAQPASPVQASKTQPPAMQA
jgi:hypothetical protein